MDSFKLYIETSEQLNALVESLKQKYPGLTLFVTQSANSIHVHEIKVPPGERGNGIGTSVMQAIQQYAQSVGLPITLQPTPEPRMKARLHKFYKGLGFKPNKGRYMDYTLGSAFGGDWLWRPRRNDV